MTQALPRIARVKRGTRAAGDSSTASGASRVGRPVFDPDAVPTRDRILQAALELFFSQGYAATSVKEITDSAGITQGGLYKHFDSKEDVLHTIIIEATEEGAALIDAEIAASGADPVHRLYALAYASTLYYTRHRMAARVATFEYVHLDEERRDDIIRHRLEMRRMVESVIRAAVASGACRLPDQGKDAVKLAATALVNVTMRATELHGPFSKVPDEDIADFHATLAVRMLGADPPATR